METDTDSESEDEIPLAKLNKRHPHPASFTPVPGMNTNPINNGFGGERLMELPIREGYGSGYGNGGSQAGVGGPRYVPNMSMGMYKENSRQQAELQALIPVGRADFGGAGDVDAPWESEQDGGYWNQNQSYERQMNQGYGGLGGDGRPRKSA